jgi:MFS family permease
MTDPQPIAAPAATLRELFGPEHRGILAGLLTLVFFVAFEAIAVATAMPVIATSLHGLSFYAWGFSAFVIGQMVGTVAGGRWTDRFGPRFPLLAGSAMFAVGLLVAGLAPVMGVFVLGRLLQGLGSGPTMVSLWGVMGRGIPGRLRPRVIALQSTAWLMPALIGPFIAGTVAEHLSWRWLFLGLLVLLPLPLLAIVPKLRHLTLEPTEPASGTSQIWWAIAVAAGVGCVQFAGQTLRWWSIPLAVLGVALVLPGARALFPAGTFQIRRGLPALIVQRGLLCGCFFGAESFVPLILVDVRGLSPSLAGLTLTAGAIGWTAGSWFQGRPTLSQPREQLVRVGAVSITLGVLAVFTVVWTSVPVWVASLAWVAGGLGMGLSMACMGVLLLATAAQNEQGHVAASAQISDTLSTAMTVGFAGILFAYLHTTHGPIATFVPIAIAVGCLGLLGVWVAGRLPHERVATGSGTASGSGTATGRVRTA